MLLKYSFIPVFLQLFDEKVESFFLFPPEWQYVRGPLNTSWNALNIFSEARVILIVD